MKVDIYFPCPSREDDICSGRGPDGGERMLMPARLSWSGGRDFCRRFNDDAPDYDDIEGYDLKDMMLLRLFFGQKGHV